MFETITKQLLIRRFVETNRDNLSPDEMRAALLQKGIDQNLIDKTLFNINIENTDVLKFYKDKRNLRAIFFICVAGFAIQKLVSYTSAHYSESIANYVYSGLLLLFCLLIGYNRSRLESMRLLSMSRASLLSIGTFFILLFSPGFFYRR